MGSRGVGQRVRRAHGRTLEEQLRVGVSSGDRTHPTDYFPRLIPAPDWDTLERGLAQRMLAINEWLRRPRGRRRRGRPERGCREQRALRRLNPPRPGTCRTGRWARYRRCRERRRLGVPRHRGQRQDARGHRADGPDARPHRRGPAEVVRGARSASASTGSWSVSGRSCDPPPESRTPLSLSSRPAPTTSTTWTTKSSPESSTPSWPSVTRSSSTATGT